MPFLLLICKVLLIFLTWKWSQGNRSIEFFHYKEVFILKCVSKTLLFNSEVIIVEHKHVLFISNERLCFRSCPRRTVAEPSSDVTKGWKAFLTRMSYSLTIVGYDFEMLLFEVRLRIPLTPYQECPTELFYKKVFFGGRGNGRKTR